MVSVSAISVHKRVHGLCFCYICTQEGSWSLFLLYLYTGGFMVSVSAISVHKRVHGL